MRFGVVFKVLRVINEPCFVHEILLKIGLGLSKEEPFDRALGNNFVIKILIVRL